MHKPFIYLKVLKIVSSICMALNEVIIDSNFFYIKYRINSFLMWYERERKGTNGHVLYPPPTPHLSHCCLSLCLSCLSQCDGKVISNSDSHLMRGLLGFLAWRILPSNCCHDLVKVGTVVHISPHVWTSMLFYRSLSGGSNPKIQRYKMGQCQVANSSVRNKQGLHLAHPSWHTSPTFPAKSALPVTRQWLGSTYNAIVMKLKISGAFKKYLCETTPEN